MYYKLNPLNNNNNNNNNQLIFGENNQVD